jgi:hypothetical protein
LIAGVSLVGALALTPRAALAYSEVRHFAYPSSVGGGGGRFYTGSPADGYTCRICHAGGAVPKVRVQGLPLDGYRPSTEYEVTVDWWDGEALSAAVEVTDSEGRPAGTLRLPAESTVESSERCHQSASEPVAGTLLAVPDPSHRSDLTALDACNGEAASDGCRQVLSVPACGAGRVRFAWRAPSWDVGPIWFSGAVVNSNDDGNTTDDGVAEVGTLLPSPSDTSASVRTYAGCHVVQLGQQSHGLLMLFALALVAALRRMLGARRMGRYMR